ncbi:DUF2292 domain-containing protein [Pseudomonas sp. EL_65y_Pfl2_R95]|uniref:DUF2292 domain-containing protein n=1 Tax=Pseudomonas sp. EL_65y_Pfl2_R95 TaxID=3088698 RepID=UPI0030D9592F
MAGTERTPDALEEPRVLHEIQRALSGLKFGSVEIAVHNGHVVQIERKEKFRLATAHQQSG